MRTLRATVAILAITLFSILLHPFSSLQAQSAQSAEILIKEPLNGQFFAIQSDVTLSGTASPDSEIILYTQAGEYAKLRSDGEGKWSYTIPTVSEGSQTIQAKVNKQIDSLSSTSAIANVTFNVGDPNPSQTSSLAETGLLLFLAIPVGIFLIVATIYAYIDYRRHKRPLSNADPNVKYSFWHHLRVVSLPVIKYRLSINVDRRVPDRSDDIRRY